MDFEVAEADPGVDHEPRARTWRARRVHLVAHARPSVVPTEHVRLAGRHPRVDPHGDAVRDVDVEVADPHAGAYAGVPGRQGEAVQIDGQLPDAEVR